MGASRPADLTLVARHVNCFPNPEQPLVEGESMFISRLWGLLTIFCLLSGAGWAQLTYKTTSQTDYSGNPSGLAVADMNRDGLPDVAVIVDSTLSIERSEEHTSELQ